MKRRGSKGSESGFGVRIARDLGTISRMQNLSMALSLQGKRALVCGASAGIGQATARALAGQGASVILLARTEAALRTLVKELPGAGHSFICADQTDHVALRLKVQAEIDARGPVEILVNNTSGPKGGAIADASADDFTAVFHQHLLANHLLAQLVIPGMKKTGYGRIVNVISTSVRVPIPGLGVSNTVRAAVASWAKTLSQEVGPFGVTVNSVLPGFTRTDRLSGLLKADSSKTGRSESEIAEEWVRAVPLRRFAEPHEVAYAIGFLASPAASYISGALVPVDGGRTPSI